MASLDIGTILVWIAAAFFLFGGLSNLIGPPGIRASYRRWGYPSWFRFVTAALEFMVAAMLLMPDYRVAGAILGTAIMLAATATLLRNREYGHAIAPPIVILLIAACAMLATSGTDI